jgi:hypothetical protein
MITKIPQRIRCFIYVEGKIFVIMTASPTDALMKYQRAVARQRPTGRLRAAKPVKPIIGATGAPAPGRAGR